MPKTSFAILLVLVLTLALVYESALAAAVSAASTATSDCASTTASGTTTTIQLITSGAFTAAAKLLVPEYERLSQNKVNISFGSSLGSTSDSIPSRLNRGERFDVIIAAAAAINIFIDSGNVSAHVDLVESYIGAAVKLGAPRPDISSVAAFTQALLGAKSVGYSDSSSGKYLTQTVFPRLGIAAEMSKTAHEIKAVPVGSIVAQGSVELGLQQLSELVPVAGIDVLGRIPQELQPSPPERFTAGITTTATGVNLCAVRDFVAFLTSPQAAPIIVKAGLTPLTSAVPASVPTTGSTGLSATVRKSLR
jgi:molybdate transport system substrate-binding protein